MRRRGRSESHPVPSPCRASAVPPEALSAPPSCDGSTTHCTPHDKIHRQSRSATVLAHGHVLPPAFVNHFLIAARVFTIGSRHQSRREHYPTNLENGQRPTQRNSNQASIAPRKNRFIARTKGFEHCSQHRDSLGCRSRTDGRIHPSGFLSGTAPQTNQLGLHLARALQRPNWLATATIIERLTK